MTGWMCVRTAKPSLALSTVTSKRNREKDEASPIQKSVKKPRNSSDCDLTFSLSRLDILGVKLKTALSWAFEDERKGRTCTVPAGVGMTLSPFLLSVVVMWIVSGVVGESPGRLDSGAGAGGGVDGVRPVRALCVRGGKVKLGGMGAKSRRKVRGRDTESWDGSGDVGAMQMK